MRAAKQSAGGGRQAQAAREAALQMVYALEIGGQDAAQIEKWFVEAHPLAPPVRERAGALLDSVVRHQEQIVELIRRHSKRWKLERISLVDRSLLKLGIAEFLAPAGASAREVIMAGRDLCLKYSHPDAQEFGQNVLEAILNDLQKAEPKAAAHAQ
ncbi:MAG TPA: transcription antitermination factor NusB [Terriglobales bacterium]|jgi:N utilization substance protein B